MSLTRTIRTIEYNKLVRNRIPEIIEADGKQCEVRILEEGEYEQCLLQKLCEEAAEAATSGGDIGELADVLEVIHALLRHKGISPEELEAERQRKRQSRGGFDRRLLLQRVVEP